MIPEEKKELSVFTPAVGRRGKILLEEVKVFTPRGLSSHLRDKVHT
jgi:hypothetical protein